MYRTTTLLPLPANDFFARITKAERAMLDAIDNPDRKAYLDRIAEAPALTAGTAAQPPAGPTGGAGPL